MQTEWKKQNYKLKTLVLEKRLIMTFDTWTKQVQNNANIL